VGGLSLARLADNPRFNLAPFPAPLKVSNFVRLWPRLPRSDRIEMGPLTKEHRPQIRAEEVVGVAESDPQETSGAPVLTATVGD
jgi:hypothetical protein